MSRSAAGTVLLAGVLLLAMRAGSQTTLKTQAASSTYWISTDEAPTYVNPEGTVEATSLFGEGGNAAYWGIIALNPGAEVTPHTHEVAEYLYILSGSAEFSAGDQTTTVRSGMAILIPAGTLHSARNDGEKPLRAVQAYVPPGPEQRFKAWSRRP